MKIYFSLFFWDSVYGMRSAVGERTLVGVQKKLTTYVVSKIIKSLGYR